MNREGEKKGKRQRQRQRRCCGSFSMHADTYQPLQTYPGTQRKLYLSLPRLAFKDAQDRRAFCESLFMIVTSQSTFV